MNATKWSSVRETYEADGGRNASDAVRKRVVFAAQLTRWA